MGIGFVEGTVVVGLRRTVELVVDVVVVVDVVRVVERLVVVVGVVVDVVFVVDVGVVDVGVVGTKPSRMGFDGFSSLVSSTLIRGTSSS